MTQPQPDPVSPPVFLDAQALIESSQPVSRPNWAWYGFGLFFLLNLIANLGSAKDSPAGDSLKVFTGLMMLVMVLLGLGGSFLHARSLRRQQHMVEAIDEMVQLRRWEPAGMLLDRFLATPVRSGRLWAQALVQLCVLLNRHHRFEDAMVVQNYLIDNELLDDGGDYLVRMSRAMTMLREDHLVDADRAISDLRRRGPSQGNAGLALLEMYRDVSTGHPDEALEMFGKHLPLMRQHLGHRVADAHALAARAYDLLGRTSEAQAAYERATVLAPVAELQRRYPELLKLADRYHPTLAPQEAA